MEINVTLVLQIFNFAVSYVVLSKFLLRPFMQRIQQKRAARASILQGLKNKDAQLAQLAKDKQDQLIAFRTHVNGTYQTPVPHLPAFPTFQEKTLPKENVDRLIAEATTLVTEKASHA